uniref:Uncharacterized protein n=1 Tax=Eutreptiella gymnastica TaxID=73025 RepID=A0A7S4D242_9EUGL
MPRWAVVVVDKMVEREVVGIPAVPVLSLSLSLFLAVLAICGRAVVPPDCSWCALGLLVVTPPLPLRELLWRCGRAGCNGGAANHHAPPGLRRALHAVAHKCPGERLHVAN